MNNANFFKDSKNMVVEFFEARARDVTLDFHQKESLPNLQDTAAITKHLVEGNYIPILQALKLSIPSEEKLVWLEEHSGLHAPLLYEQAIAEYKTHPTKQGFIRSASLLKAATFRAKQDSQCCLDPTISKGEVADQISGIYEYSLNKFRREDGITLDPLSKELSSAIKTKITETALKSLREPLPPPNWIGLSNTQNSWFDLKTPPGEAYMFPASTHKEIRDNYAKKTASLMRNSM